MKKIRRRFDRYKEKYFPDPHWRPPVTVADVQVLLDKIDDLKARLKAERAR